jgi:hypothetical protein
MAHDEELEALDRGLFDEAKGGPLRFQDVDLKVMMMMMMMMMMMVMMMMVMMMMTMMMMHLSAGG